MLDINLIDYIKSSLTENKTKEEIYKSLIENDYKIDEVQCAFDCAEKEIKNDSEDHHKKSIQMITVFGGILMILGILFYVSSIWQNLSEMFKILTIIILVSMSYASGWKLKNNSNYKRCGFALIGLGVLFYGAGIFLLVSEYKVMLNFADGTIFWMLGTLFTALALKSRLLFYFIIILGFIAVFSYSSIFFNSSDYKSISNISLFLFFISSIGTFLIGWNIRKKIPLEIRKFY